MRKRCISCGALLFDKPLMKLNNMPASAQGIPGENEIESDNGVDISVCECSGCGLIQLDSDPVWYYRDVIRSGGYTTTMAELRRSQYGRFIDRFNLTGKKIIEVGCGQGEFLKTLTEFPVSAYGIEHKKELADKATASGLNVICSFPEQETDIFPNGPFDAFTSFNLLEHQPDPCMYLRSIYNNLTEDGSGLVTVPSLQYILDKKTYYEIIPDHIAYYTEDSLRILLEHCGFDVVGMQTVNRDTIEAFVQKKHRIDFAPVTEAFAGIIDDINKIAENILVSGKTLAVWGASHQGFTILSTSGVEAGVSFIIDSAVFKQGRYSPASHVPIISPEEAVKKAPDAIIIIAPGYSDEIAGLIKKNFKKDIEIYTLRTDKLEKLS